MQPHIQFYFIPNKKLAILWSPKCACGAIGNWAKAAISEFDDFSNSPDPRFGADARFNLNRRGYNFNLYNLKALIKTNNVQIVAVSTRDPVSRMRSSFINKFLIHKGRVIKNFSDLELFSKDFVRRTRRTPLTAGTKAISMSKKSNSFLISLASFTEAVSIEKEVRLIDSHFKPQLLEDPHLETITNIMGNVLILPLRTERLQEDMTALNRATGLDYMPAKDNASDLPDGWQTSEAEESVLMSNMELIEHQIIPSLNALRTWLRNHTSIGKAFERRFSWDYKLVNFLEKRES
jgi:hypothetical protein